MDSNRAEREKELRFNVKWNRRASYIGIALSLVNALIGSAFCFVTFGLAALNWYVANKCEDTLNEEFPND